MNEAVMEITETKLLDKGYKRFETSFEKSKSPDTYICSYQKKISDEVGKKYFITMHYHEYYFNGEFKSFYSFDCQFRRKEGHYVDIDLHFDEDLAIEEAERFYEELWTKMEFRYYERWDEN